MQAKLQEWTAQLLRLMEQLNDGDIAIIEFGDPAFIPSDYYTRLRIRMTMTPGGFQYGLRFVSSFRGEGSGQYFPRDEAGKQACIRAAMREVEQYVTPTGWVAIDKTRSRSHGHLRFSGFKNEKHVQAPLLQLLHAQEEAEGRGFLPDAVTIRLD